ncbi:winged helix-turn-helix domain-containing protein [Streptomyces tauricus]
MEPRALDLLCHLVERRDRVVAKNELLDEVWGDREGPES